MSERVVVDPITRIEGHLRIEAQMNGKQIESAYSSGTMVRGIEVIMQGRDPRDAWAFVQRICGVCSEAHHLAAAKACDDTFHVEIPPAARKLRELMYSAFFTGDHLTHFFILGGPDFVMGPESPPAERNILGMIHKLGIDTGKVVIEARAAAHDIVKILGGKTIHMVTSIPGGVTKGGTPEERD